MLSMRRTVLATALASLTIAGTAGITGCDASSKSEPTPPPPTFDTAFPTATTSSGIKPVAVGGTVAWPDGLKATATVLGKLRPADRTDVKAGVVDEKRLAGATEKLLGEPSRPMGLRVKLTNTGDTPLDLDKVELQWVGIQLGGMAQKAGDDGGFKGRLAAGKSVTQLSAWAVPDIVAVRYQVLVWPEGVQKGAVGGFTGDVPGASVRPDHSGHAH